MVHFRFENRLGEAATSTYPPSHIRSHTHIRINKSCIRGGNNGIFETTNQCLK